MGSWLYGWKNGNATGKDKSGKQKNAKDKLNKNKAGKRSGTPKSKGSGPYDRQSVSVEGRKGVDESSLLTVSEFDGYHMSQKTEEVVDQQPILGVEVETGGRPQKKVEQIEKANRKCAST